MFLQGWVNGILTNESSVYGTLCIVLLKILNMGLYFSEIDTRGWPYRRRDLLFPFNQSFADELGRWEEAKVVLVEAETQRYCVRFVGWGEKFNRLVTNSEIRRLHDPFHEPGEYI